MVCASVGFGCGSNQHPRRQGATVPPTGAAAAECQMSRVLRRIMIDDWKERGTASPNQVHVSRQELGERLASLSAEGWATLERCGALHDGVVTPNACDRAWVGVVGDRVSALSKPALTAARTATERARFMEDCSALPHRVQRCLVKSHGIQHVADCPPGEAGVELLELRRSRCPGFADYEECLQDGCAWSTAHEVCVAP